MTQTQQLSLDDALTLAVKLHQQARLEEAEQVYRAILQQVPSEPDAQHNLGLLLRTTHRLHEALPHLAQACHLRADIPEYWVVLIDAQLEAGLVDDARRGLESAALAPNADRIALESLQSRLSNVEADGREPSANQRERALGFARRGEFSPLLTEALAMVEAYPQSIFAWKCLSAAHRSLGSKKKALEAAQQALALAPDDVEALCNTGVACIELKKFSDAIGYLRRAKAVSPKSFAAHYNLSLALREAGALEEAEAMCRRALQLDQSSADAKGCLVETLVKQGRLTEAKRVADVALEENPHSLPLLVASMLVHLGHGNYLGSTQMGELATRLFPRSAIAWALLGDAYAGIGTVADAASAYRKSLEVDPEMAGSKFGLGCSLYRLGDWESSEKLLLDLCDEPRFALQAVGNLLMWRNRELRGTPQENLALAKRWSLLCKPIVSGGRNVQTRSNRMGRALRIGYLSGDFRNHAVAHFILNVLKSHDWHRVEVYCYHTLVVEDDVTAQVRLACQKFSNLAGMTDQKIAETIRDDELDVLVDLSAHTAHNKLRVVAQRLAPVQAHYLGYYATTGVPAMDYWIGDSVLIPEEHSGHFTEVVWRLDRPWIMYQPANDAPAPNVKPDDGLLVLGSYNRADKIGPAAVSLWSRVLEKLPGSILLLKNNHFIEAKTREQLMAQFLEHGIQPNRVVFETPKSTPTWVDHMASYGRIDIALDPVGAQGGGTTTCDALWMGVPVVCLKGDRMATRMSASLISGMGRSEWVVDSQEAYIAKVLELAADKPLRDRLRLTLRDEMRASPLCDAKGMATALEDAYEAMFDKWWKSRGKEARV